MSSKRSGCCYYFYYHYTCCYLYTYCYYYENYYYEYYYCTTSGAGVVDDNEAMQRQYQGVSKAPLVSVFEMSLWGKFTPALNVLLTARDGADLILFQVCLVIIALLNVS